jgi:hypothetical protein
MGDDPAKTASHSELDPEISELQDEFSLHESRATEWFRHIGDVETCQREVGKNGPAGYVDLILKREAAITTLKERRNELKSELISPLMEWRRDLRTSQYAGSEDTGSRDLFQEYVRRSKIVRSELFPRDEELQEAKYTLSKIDQQLSDIYSSYLTTQSTEFDTKKERIIELKRSFPYLRASDDLMAEVVDTTQTYSQQITVSSDGEIRDRQVPTQLRNRTLERDDHTCVNCGATDSLEAHHIIPRCEGGPDTLKNMATLCSECHTAVHGNIPYDTTREFWREYADSKEYD